MAKSIAETTVANGMKVFCLNADEVPTLYEQIQTYLKHGIELHPGDTIFDVGANIGLFSLWADRYCQNQAKIYAFEPIQAVFEVLRANADRVSPERIHVFPYGLARESKQVTFAYHPHATVLSSAYQEDLPELRQQLKQSILRNSEAAPLSIRQILRWLPQFLRSRVLDLMLDRAFQIEPVVCQLRTVSEIVREENIEKIDLLKVDVEKGELEVLLGIETRDWDKIEQVAIEVHDLNGRLEAIKALLDARGLSEIAVEQEPLFQGSSLYNLYAWRSKTE